jgi:SAM-dependent methyltransferase
MQPTDRRLAEADEAEIRERLLDMLCGFLRTQALATAATLGVADLVTDQPTDVGELARQVGVHEPSLYRLLRALSNDGVFAEVESRRFVRTPLSDGLRSDAPLTARWSAMFFGSEHYGAWTEAIHSFRTGEPAFERVYGVPFFDYLERNAEASAIFNRAMSAGTRSRIAALMDYDWSGVRRVVDVGGGNGTTLAAVLADNPHLAGAIFELESGLTTARTVMEDAGVAGRCELISGDFFVGELPQGDAYVLSQILHDWDDARAAMILRNCRRSLTDGGRLLILDAVVPSGPEPDFRKLFDLHMLVLIGGKERTEREWSELLASERFSLRSIRPAGRSHLLEAWSV